MATHAPVLDLTTLIPRETIRIDGVRYDLRADKELSIFDLAQLEQTAAKIHKVETDSDRTAEQMEEYAHLLDKAVRLVLIAPDALHAKLLVAHREAILWTFIGLSRRGLAPTRAPRETTPAKARPTTRSRSARGSRASTAGRPATG